MASASNNPKNLHDWSLLLLRVAVGASFLAHGMQKWAQWNAPTDSFMAAMMKVLSIVEPVMGAATIMGLLSPVAAGTLFLVMVGAMYMKIVTWGAGFASGKVMWELDFILLAANAVLFTYGPGALSLDTILKNNEAPRPKKKKGRK